MSIRRHRVNFFFFLGDPPDPVVIQHADESSTNTLVWNVTQQHISALTVDDEGKWEIRFCAKSEDATPQEKPWETVEVKFVAEENIHQHTHVLEELQTNVEYDVQVRGVNMRGSSVYSNVVVCKIPPPCKLEHRNQFFFM